MNKLIILTHLIFCSQFGMAQVEEVKNKTSWGKLENNQKVGNWQYYDEPGKLSLMVNHSTGKIIFFEKDTSKYLIKKEGDWVLSHVVNPPHYLGSKMDFFNFIGENLTYPPVPLANNKTGQAAVSFEIDEQGAVSHFEIIKSEEGWFARELLGLLKAAPPIWIPAAIETGPVPSKIIFLLGFGINNSYTPRRRDKKEYPELYEEKPYIYEMVVTAKKPQ
ncbi:energy transducer TonB [Reichenbachiella sp. MSK19-1]|uniref:energy transducer TonB n=1 Tax=Reichenbachiella sp. MSK19-1 TaxID=1897631 RepID=UPI0011C3EE43|nr:hypothetical protein [Reichenbachiella sp. MSK19-1]